ncbi:MAG: hypothetical protein C4308_01160 [Chitinophagaceae bacterium]
MRFFFFVFLLLPACNLFSQSATDTHTLNSAQQIDTSRIVKPSNETITIRERDEEKMEQNLQQFVKLQKEREQKQKRQAYIRIGLGVLLLVVLIVGLTRKKKK